LEEGDKRRKETEINKESEEYISRGVMKCKIGRTKGLERYL